MNLTRAIRESQCGKARRSCWRSGVFVELDYDWTIVLRGREKCDLFTLFELEADDWEPIVEKKESEKHIHLWIYSVSPPSVVRVCSEANCGYEEYVNIDDIPWIKPDES